VILRPAPAPAAAPVAAAPQAATASRTVYHRVAQGETLAALARRYYGSTAAWTKILAANRDRCPSPSALRPGTVLVIPLAAPAAPVAPVAPAAPAAAPVTAPRGGGGGGGAPRFAPLDARPFMQTAQAPTTGRPALLTLAARR